MSSTTIVNRQIANGAIDDSKVAAGANIASSKLADGANFTKKDGSVTWTGSQSAGGNKLTNIGTPTPGSTDATRQIDLENAIAALNSTFDGKPSVRAASTVNITISSPGSIFDGVTLSNGDRLLLKNQTTQSQNGIYIFNGSSSALTRASDMDNWLEVPGALVAVEDGTANADTVWLCTSNQGGTIGTTAITWQTLNVVAGLYNSNFVDKETPSGTIDGSNAAFTLAYTPVTGSEHVYLNGLLQDAGSGNDYTISGSTITFVTSPLSGEKIRVSYRK